MAGTCTTYEEDVASSSITQDSAWDMRRCFIKLLEDLGSGNADAFAHLRPANERKNCF